MNSHENKIVEDFKDELTKRLYKEDDLMLDISEWAKGYKRRHPNASSRNIKRAVERQFNVKISKPQ